jgi:hypothetical protein
MSELPLAPILSSGPLWPSSTAASNASPTAASAVPNLAATENSATPQTAPSLPVSPSAPVPAQPVQPAPQPSPPLVQALALAMGIIALGILMRLVRRWFKKF